jgi:hypothetical protein
LWDDNTNGGRVTHPAAVFFHSDARFQSSKCAAAFFHQTSISLRYLVYPYERPQFPDPKPILELTSIIFEIILTFLIVFLSFSLLAAIIDIL